MNKFHADILLYSGECTVMEVELKLLEAALLLCTERCQRATAEQNARFSISLFGSTVHSFPSESYISTDFPESPSPPSAYRQTSFGCHQTETPTSLVHAPLSPIGRFGGRNPHRLTKDLHYIPHRHRYIDPLISAAVGKERAVGI